MLGFRLWVSEGARLYTGLRVVWFVWVIFRGWGNMPVFAALVVRGWFSREWEQWLPCELDLSRKLLVSRLIHLPVSHNNLVPIRLW